MKEILETEVILPNNDDATFRLVKDRDFEVIDFVVDGVTIFSGDISNFMALFTRARELWEVKEDEEQ